MGKRGPTDTVPHYAFPIYALCTRTRNNERLTSTKHMTSQAVQAWFIDQHTCTMISAQWRVIQRNSSYACQEVDVAIIHQQWTDTAHEASRSSDRSTVAPGNMEPT
jgi:hypothetical protein